MPQFFDATSFPRMNHDPDLLMPAQSMSAIPRLPRPRNDLRQCGPQSQREAWTFWSERLAYIILTRQYLGHQTEAAIHDDDPSHDSPHATAVVSTCRVTARREPVPCQLQTALSSANTRPSMEMVTSSSGTDCPDKRRAASATRTRPVQHGTSM